MTSRPDDEEPYDDEYLDLAVMFLLMIPVAGILCLVAMVLCIVFT